mgnify:CR=1 FL=1
MNKKDLILFFAGYGIVQVLAQDLNIDSSEFQKKIVNFIPFQLALLFSGGYMVTEREDMTIMILLLYYILRNIKIK